VSSSEHRRDDKLLFSDHCTNRLTHLPKYENRFSLKDLLPKVAYMYQARLQFIYLIHEVSLELTEPVKRWEHLVRWGWRT